VTLRLAIGYRLTWDRRHLRRVDRCEARALFASTAIPARDEMLIWIDRAAERAAHERTTKP
jgi:hypothetical protein